jgi:hypothetical protein
MNPLLDEIPVACSLSGKEMAQRRDEITQAFLPMVQETRELADGYALRFAGDRECIARLLSFVEGERACCPFFTFELIFEPRQGPVWLHLRGPAGTKEIVAHLLDHDESHYSS